MPHDTVPTIDDTPRQLQFKTLAAQNLLLGGASGVWTGENFTGDAFAIQCLTECTFTTFTENQDTGSVINVAIPAGTVILNPFGITAAVAGGGELFRAYLR